MYPTNDRREFVCTNFHFFFRVFSFSIRGRPPHRVFENLNTRENKKKK